jgi:predicted chitinase
VQLTGRSNYTKMQRRFGVDLTSSDKAADRALEPELAAKIMFYGMERGAFTGKKFADYFSEDRDRWVQARSIINPGDKPRLVADYALDYYAAISYTT